MSQTVATALGATAGLTIFLGLPVARLRGLSRRAQGFMNAVATGILVFLLWDILAHATGPVEKALTASRGTGVLPFAVLALVFAAGIGVGLLSLVYSNRRLAAHFRRAHESTPSRDLAMMIATGLGLHNLSEGLAMGQSAATGAVALFGVLVVGFALHNVTEGFGIAAPMAVDPARPSWGFLALTGLIGGGPTFLGTVVGYLAVSPVVYVLFLALAAGALLYVLNEMFPLCRRLNSPSGLAWGLLAGFLAAYSTDLLLTFAAA